MVDIGVVEVGMVGCFNMADAGIVDAGMVGAGMVDVRMIDEGMIGNMGITIEDCYLIRRRSASEAILQCFRRLKTLCSPTQGKVSMVVVRIMAG